MTYDIEYLAMEWSGRYEKNVIYGIAAVFKKSKDYHVVEWSYIPESGTLTVDKGLVEWHSFRESFFEKLKDEEGNLENNMYDYDEERFEYLAEKWGWHYE